MTGNENTVFALIKADGMQRLVCEFYAQIKDDDLLGPMYPQDDLAGAEERLRDFLTYRFGGPQDYLTKRGNPMLRARHAPFEVTPAAAERWMKLMSNAFDRAKLPEDAEQIMKPFLQNVAQFLINSSPKGPIPG
ncbi:MAG: globin [Fuerstiella sp.]